jgi:uncharacterized protein (TIGR02147 family)
MKEPVGKVKSIPNAEKTATPTHRGSPAELPPTSALVQLLKSTLQARMMKNPSYSMRAFAKSLGLSPSALSMILSNKLELSQKRLNKIITTLCLDPKQAQKLLAQSTTSKKLNVQTAKHADASAGHPMSSELFELLADWKSFAILSLTELKSETFTPRSVARRLGITLTEATLAIQTLKSANMLTEEKSSEGSKWRQSTAPLRTTPSLTHSAGRRAQKQWLERAIDALETMPSEKRDITSMTFAMRKEDFEMAQDRITEFRRELSQELENQGSPDSVFTLTIQLVPLTKE